MLIPSNSAFVGWPTPPRRRHRDDWVLEASKSPPGDFSNYDRRLASIEEPPLGGHLVTPRFGYVHHGVYVGAGTVVHYAAFAYRWRRGPVEEVSLSRFAHGRPVWVRSAGPDALPCEEIVRRARSRLGESRYRLLSNNCEHFSEWCVHGCHRSRQAERLLGPLRWVSRGLGWAMRYAAESPVFRRSGSPKLSVAWASRGRA